MAFFDDVGKKIAQTSQGAAQKAKNMAETVKLNGQISDEEKHINNAFLQIGKTYYETYTENPDQLFAQLIAGINDSKAKITAYSEQVKQLKGIVRCPKCGAEVPYESAFCASCGSPMNTAAATQRANGRLCPKCGAPVSEDKAFCTNCGNKLEPQTAAAPFVQPEPVTQAQYTAPVIAVTAKCPGCGNALPAGSRRGCLTPSWATGSSR